MKLSWNKKFFLLVVGGISFMSLIAYFGGDCNVGKPDHGPIAVKSQKTTTAIAAQKPTEFTGQIVGGPQIVTGSPLIGYAVHVEELKGIVALYATQCPLLANGQRVIMGQTKSFPKSEWYTFIRYAE